MSSGIICSTICSRTAVGPCVFPLARPLTSAATSLHRPRPSPRRLLPQQAPVSRRYELLVCPRAFRVAVKRIVIERGPRRLNLVERHALFYHGAQPVANDRQHIAIFHHVDAVRNPPVA